MTALATMPQYETYKDSGIEWLGKIPYTWNIEKAKWLFIKKERSVRLDDDIVTCFRDGQVTLRSNRRTEGFTNALKEHGYQGIRKGDLIIHAMDAFAGSIGVSDSDGKSTPVYSACVPRKANLVNPYFYAYYLRDLALSGFIVSLAKGIRERSTDFRFNDFAQLFLPLPCYEEQTTIAHFLDQKTAQIDAAIAIKQQQIALLKERKQILIQQAVTQGLDPTVPMKDSGVEWIGKIPAHWEVKRVKVLSSFITSGPRGWADFLSDTGSYFLQSGNLNNSLGIELHQAHRISPPNNAEGRRTRIFDNDVLVCITGANTGRVAVAKVGGNEVFINQHLCLIRLNNKVNPKFFAYSLQSKVGKEYFSIARYGLKEGLNLSDVRDAPVLVAPIKEQNEIVAHIEVESETLDSALQLQQQQIEKLKEYKTTLINSAVTGKIKVA